MPQPLTHGKRSEYRGEAVCQFAATLTVGKSKNSEGRFSSFFVIFDHFSSCLQHRHSGKRSKSFRIVCGKTEDSVGSERAVHMCERGPNRSLAGGAARRFFEFLELTQNLGSRIRNKSDQMCSIYVRFCKTCESAQNLAAPGVS